MLNLKRINLVVDETLRLKIITKPSFIDLAQQKYIICVFKKIKKHIILKLIFYISLMYYKKR